MLLHFPAEIVNRVSSYLSHGDFHHLVLVNQACYYQFTPFLYQKMSFKDGDQFKQFSNESKHFHPHVRNLHLPYFSEIMRILPRLPFMFPSLDSINLTVSDAHCPPQFCEPFRTLRVLTMKTFGLPASSIEIIAAMPYLTHLDITLLANAKITVNLLNDLHQLCPLLQRLYIKGSFKDIFTEKTESQPVQIVDKLKLLHLESTSSLYEHHFWLKHIAFTYPNLETLSLGQQTVSIEKQYSSEFYDWFRSSCPHIIQFKWLNIVPDDNFFKKLDQQQCQLQELRLNDATLVKHLLMEVEPSHDTYLSAIFNLDIRISIDTTYDTLLSFLGRVCYQLEQFAIEQYDSHSPDELYMDTILDLLPRLTSVSFTQIRIGTKSRKADFDSHPLEKIKLKGCHIPYDTFDSIGFRCPYLSNLILDQTSHSDHLVKIHLPYQKLNKVELNSIYLSKLDLDAVVQLFRMKQANRSDWYLMDSYKKPAYSRTIIAKSFKKLNNTMSHLSYSSQKLESQSDNHTNPFLPYALRDPDLRNAAKDGYVDLVCQSVCSLYINSKKVK
ncbi:hypothetical protein EDC96DRAFT_496251 [Choanephora cucurbitarum]|nr:hypothetical protein EDC96DRAFT_496251 [Choanephora cucurbitarum]